LRNRKFCALKNWWKFPPRNFRSHSPVPPSSKVRTGHSREGMPNLEICARLPGTIHEAGGRFVKPVHLNSIRLKRCAVGRALFPKVAVICPVIFNHNRIKLIRFFFCGRSLGGFKGLTLPPKGRLNCLVYYFETGGGPAHYPSKGTADLPSELNPGLTHYPSNGTANLPYAFPHDVAGRLPSSE
jgi:hypothetical protein